MVLDKVGINARLTDEFWVLGLSTIKLLIILINFLQKFSART